MQIRPSELLRILNGEYIRLPANLGARVYDDGGGFTHDKTGNWVTIDEFDTERWDMGICPSYANGFWDVANPERLTAVKSGFYHVYAHVVWGASGDTSTRLGLRIVYFDGANPNVVTGLITAGVQYCSQSVNSVIWMEPGQYIYAEIFQESGGNLSLWNGSQYDWNNCEFGLQRIP